MKKLLLIFLASLAFSTQAAVQIVEQGKLTGATGVDVDGTLYDVSFQEGSCMSLFNGCTSFTFGIEQARVATSALLDQVLIDSQEGLFDSNPALTWGVNMSETEILTPWLFEEKADPGLLDLRVYSAYNTTKSDQVLLNEYFCCNGLQAMDTTNSVRYVYAVWSVTAAPEPEIYAMMLVGLGILGWQVRRKQA